MDEEMIQILQRESIEWIVSQKDMDGTKILSCRHTIDEDIEKLVVGECCQQIISY